ncbi:FAD:protein FMN transferase [Paraferrimonas haliotis]|uniref:FAD:protein FMN transferase n=1 Tax=Paraferrimonas haliotis TaxID=2013866 RepID=UPI000BA98588|nr:FAD:protein FMN transferase [Paraferrimonas haliotis]
MSLSRYWFVVTVVVLAVVSSKASANEHLITGKTMGSNYSVRYLVNDNDAREAKVAQAIDAEIEIVNQAMSTWRPRSEISLFNHSKSTSSIPVSDAFAEVLTEGIRLHKLSGGALDFSIGPLIDLWGFGAAGKRYSPPSLQQSLRVREITGMDKFRFKEGRLSKSNPNAQINLSAIAKGYAVDRVAKRLIALKINNFIVDIGGELSVSGHSSTGPWQIEIESPTGLASTQTLVIDNQAVATSGDYKQFYEYDGEHYSHVFDPRIGMPVKREIVSATVIADTCMTADGLATASIALGVQKALALAEQQGYPLYLIERVESDAAPVSFKVHYSSSFKPYLSNQNN